MESEQASIKQNLALRWMELRVFITIASVETINNSKGNVCTTQFGFLVFFGFCVDFSASLILE